jgi:hypothetical protein
LQQDEIADHVPERVKHLPTALLALTVDHADDVPHVVRHVRVTAHRVRVLVHIRTLPAKLRMLRNGLERVGIAAIVVNPDRAGRVQSRVVKRRPSQYSRMTKRRAALKRELMKARGP